MSLEIGLEVECNEYPISEGQLYDTSQVTTQTLKICRQRKTSTYTYDVKQVRIESININQNEDYKIVQLLQFSVRKNLST